MKFPKHNCGLTLSHNEHKNYYEKICDYIHSRKIELTIAEMEKCIKEDSIWELQWYPDNPVGFHFVAASSLEEVLRIASEIEGEK